VKKAAAPVKVKWVSQLLSLCTDDIGRRSVPWAAKLHQVVSAGHAGPRHDHKVRHLVEVVDKANAKKFSSGPGITQRGQQTGPSGEALGVYTLSICQRSGLAHQKVRVGRGIGSKLGKLRRRRNVPAVVTRAVAVFEGRQMPLHRGAQLVFTSVWCHYPLDNLANSTFSAGETVNTDLSGGMFYRRATDMIKSSR